MNYYEYAKEFVGLLPPQFEFIYGIVTVVFIFATILVLLTPMLILIKVFEKR